MINIATFKKIALSFAETNEQPHFEKTSFRVGKKIFATYDSKNNRACNKLSIADQDIFCLYDKSIIFPVHNKWGKQGWTFIHLSKIKKQLFTDALTLAYGEVAPKKLTNLIKSEEKK